MGSELISTIHKCYFHTRPKDIWHSAKQHSKRNVDYTELFTKETKGNALLHYMPMWCPSISTSTLGYTAPISQNYSEIRKHAKTVTRIIESMDQLSYVK